MVAVIEGFHCSMLVCIHAIHVIIYFDDRNYSNCHTDRTSIYKELAIIFHKGIAANNIMSYYDVDDKLYAFTQEEQTQY